MIETFESRIEDNQPLLISIVNRIHKRLPPFILYEDVLSYGQVGLAQAARTYQPQPGAKFSTYAYYRISGAIYDGIARMNWSSRVEYRKYRAMQNANEVLSSTNDSYSGSDSDDNAKWFADSTENLFVVYSFSASDPENPIENQIAGDEDSPMEVAETNELVEKLREVVGRLPDEERQLIQYVYFDGLSLSEAAEKIGGKSRSWGSRLHAKILGSLSNQLLHSKS